MKPVSAVVLGVAAVASAALLAAGLRDIRTGDRYVTVKGVAEREVQADLALWPLRFVATGETLESAQAGAKRSLDAILGFVGRHGLDGEAVELQRLDVTDTRANAYQASGAGDRFIINQTLMLRSGDIEKVGRASQRIGELVDAGVVLSADYGPSGPTYVFSRLNDIKPEMIAAATASAREAAAQFAADAGAALGGLRNASQGVFQILPRDQAPGIQEQQQPVKTVRVVTTVEYFLK